MYVGEYVMKTVISATVAASLLAFGGPAAAKTEKSVQRDPNEKVCEDIIPVGTRLAVKRVCATRAQWEEKRRQDRAWTEDSQRKACVRGSISAGQETCGSF